LFVAQIFNLLPATPKRCAGRVSPNCIRQSLHKSSRNQFGRRADVIGGASARLDAAAALAASGSLPENVNYAVKSSFLFSFLHGTAPSFASVE
jgi:hypothetical protein